MVAPTAHLDTPNLNRFEVDKFEKWCENCIDLRNECIEFHVQDLFSTFIYNHRIMKICDLIMWATTTTTITKIIW